MDWKPRSEASARALRTDSRMERSDERHHMLMPATWMIDLNGSLPAPVMAAPPKSEAEGVPRIDAAAPRDTILDAVIYFAAMTM